MFLPSAAARELTLLNKRSVINYPLNLKISKDEPSQPVLFCLKMIGNPSSIIIRIENIIIKFIIDKKFYIDSLFCTQ